MSTERRGTAAHQIPEPSRTVVGRRRTSMYIQHSRFFTHAGISLMKCAEYQSCNIMIQQYFYLAEVQYIHLKTNSLYYCRRESLRNMSPTQSPLRYPRERYSLLPLPRSKQRQQLLNIREEKDQILSCAAISA